MIEKCPECNEKIDVLLTQEPNSSSAEFTYSMSTTYYNETYSPTSKIYKCSNPKCWITKINESWG